MIDTIKIYAEIENNLYNKIKDSSIVKSAVNRETGEELYNIINSHLEGSYSSSLSVKVSCSSKYRLCSTGYVIEIEGSYHKIKLGYNSHNGFYDLREISQELINIVNSYYDIVLPAIDFWYLQRCDIAICFDLKNQHNICEYINNLSSCNYSRRKVKFFSNESLYISGTTTTIKIYNKLLEFKKHDMKKFINTDFDLVNYMNTICGFIRFECEVKKKMLEKIYNSKHIQIINVSYKDLKNIWSDEFMKLLKFVKNDLVIVSDRVDVFKRLKEYYSNTRAINLYNFYLMCKSDGVENVKNKLSRATFYRQMGYLKQVNFDVSQKFNLTDTENTINFNPFSYEEVI